MSYFSLNSYRLYTISLLSIGFFLASCEKPRPVVAQEQKKDVIQLPSLPKSREADDIARFFAALPASEGSPLAELEKSPSWTSHKTQMDTAWAKTDLQLLQGLRQFSNDELNLPIVAGRTVYYPFSGPDMMVPSYYFPKAPLYILVGLEPPGTLPTIEQIQKKANVPTYLAAMRETMASILGRSFFVTKEMDSELRGQVTDGILMPMLHLLVRTNHTILGVRYVRVGDGGRIVERPAVYKTDAKYANRGVEVEFTSAPGAPSQRAYYFSVNVDDKHLGDNAPFRAFLARVKDVLTFLKATSYMTHHPEFSIIRDHAVASSVLVIQDDSGIPFHFFMPDQWTVKLFGAYDKPYGSFRYMQQKDLRDAFKTASAKPLPMHIGYGYRRIESNVELAIRNGAKPLVEETAAVQPQK